MKTEQNTRARRCVPRRRLGFGTSCRAGLPDLGCGNFVHRVRGAREPGQLQPKAAVPGLPELADDRGPDTVRTIRPGWSIPVSRWSGLPVSTVFADREQICSSSGRAAAEGNEPEPASAAGASAGVTRPAKITARPRTERIGISIHQEVGHPALDSVGRVEGVVDRGTRPVRVAQTTRSAIRPPLAIFVSPQSLPLLRAPRTQRRFSAGPRHSARRLPSRKRAENTRSWRTPRRRGRSGSSGPS